MQLNKNDCKLNNANNIVSLATNKLIEADLLYANGFYDTAYYLAGYSVELLIKARICQTLKIENFYDFDNRAKFVNEDSITKPYKVHNFAQLLVLSGIYNEFVKQLKDFEFINDWTCISKWKEDARYATGKQQGEVKEFIFFVKKFEKWIEQYL